MPPELYTALIGFAVLFIGALGTLITAIVVMIRKLSETHTKNEELDLAAREYFQTQYTTLNEEYKRLIGEVGTLKEKVTELTYELATERGNAESLRKRTISNEETISSLKDELKTYQTENGQLISSNAKLSKDNQILKEQKERAEKLNKQYSKQIAEYRKEIDDLKLQIKGLDMRLRHYEGMFIEIQRSGNQLDDTQKIPQLDDALKTPITGEEAEDTARIITITDEDDNEKDSA